MNEILPSATEEDFDLKGREDAQLLRSALGDDRIILDVGCGIGRIEKFLAPSCKELHAVDVSPVMLKKASQRLAGFSNVRLMLVNGRDLNLYSNCAFDGVFCLLVLQHLDYEDAFHYLLEFNRILKTDGICVLQFPDFCLDSIFNAFAQHATISPRLRPRARTKGYTREQINFELSRAGFDIEDFRHSGDQFIVVSRKKEAFNQVG